MLLAISVCERSRHGTNSPRVVEFGFSLKNKHFFGQAVALLALAEIYAEYSIILWPMNLCLDRQNS